MTLTKDRLGRLTDAYVDGTIEKELFVERKNAIVTEQRRLECSISNAGEDYDAELNELEKNLELAGTALLSYETGNAEEKRQLVQNVTSNRSVSGKNIVFEPRSPYRMIAERDKNQCCGPNRGKPRMLETIIKSVSDTASDEIVDDRKIQDSG